MNTELRIEKILDRHDPFASAMPIHELLEHGQRLFPNRPALADLLMSGPGHDGYAYNADVYCVQCGQDIIRDLYRQGEYNEHGDTEDSEQFPQPIFFGESDCVEHCGECEEYLYGPQDDADADDDDADGLDRYGNEN